MRYSKPFKTFKLLTKKFIGIVDKNIYRLRLNLHQNPIGSNHCGTVTYLVTRHVYCMYTFLADQFQLDSNL